MEREPDRRGAGGIGGAEGALPTLRDFMDRIMKIFPIVKRKEIQAHGHHRIKRRLLDIYDRMRRAIDTGEPYQTLLDPPPGHPSVAHPESTRPEWARRGEPQP